MKDSYVPSSGDLVLGWECAFTNEFVPSLHCVRQPDKNIRCQLAAWRGEDSSANEADPLTVSPLLARSVSLWEHHSSYYSPGLGELVQGWLLSTSTTMHTHPPHSVLHLFPVWVCAWMCKWALWIETTLHHHDYIMKRNRDREKNRGKQIWAAQELTVWGLKETGLTEVRMKGVLDPWNNSPGNSTAATGGTIVRASSNLWAHGFRVRQPL